MLQLNKVLGKPKPGGVNPFMIFAKSQTVERGDAPLTVTSLICDQLMMHMYCFHYSFMCGIQHFK